MESSQGQYAVFIFTQKLNWVTSLAMLFLADVGKQCNSIIKFFLFENGQNLGQSDNNWRKQGIIIISIRSVKAS